MHSIELPDTCKNCPIMRNAQDKLTQLEFERGFFSYVMDSMVTDDETAEHLEKNAAKIGLEDINFTETSSNAMSRTDRAIEEVIRKRQAILDACASGMVGVTVSVGERRGVISYCGSKLAQPNEENPSVPLTGTFSLLPDWHND